MRFAVFDNNLHYMLLGYKTKFSLWQNILIKQALSATAIFWHM